MIYSVAFTREEASPQLAPSLLLFVLCASLLSPDELYRFRQARAGSRLPYFVRGPASGVVFGNKGAPRSVA